MQPQSERQTVARVFRSNPGNDLGAQKAPKSLRTMARSESNHRPKSLCHAILSIIENNHTRKRTRYGARHLGADRLARVALRARDAGRLDGFASAAKIRILWMRVFGGRTVLLGLAAKIFTPHPLRAEAHAVQRQASAPFRPVQNLPTSLQSHSQARTRLRDAGGMVIFGHGRPLRGCGADVKFC